MAPKAVLLAALAAASAFGPTAAAFGVSAPAMRTASVRLVGIDAMRGRPPKSRGGSRRIVRRLSSSSLSGEEGKGEDDNSHAPAKKTNKSERVPSRVSDYPQIADDDDKIDLEEYGRKIQDNVLGGKAGQRGEVYVFLQFAVLLCIGLGDVPIVGEALTSVVGTGLIFGGLAASYLGAIELGTALSPWPVPIEGSDGKLATDGVFGLVRHPMFAGLLIGMTGLSIVTDSANRLLLTVLLAFVLNLKADYEEKKMAEVYPEYEEYKKEVRGRFLPDNFVRNVTSIAWKIIE